MIRFAAVYYGMLGAVVISRTVDSFGEAVIFLGAVAVAFEAMRRVVGKPMAALYRKADHAFDQMASFPAWRQKVDERLEQIEGKLEADVRIEEIHHIRS